MTKGTERERESETDRQTDRQTDRDRQRQKMTKRQIDMQPSSPPYRVASFQMQILLLSRHQIFHHLTEQASSSFGSLCKASRMMQVLSLRRYLNVDMTLSKFHQNRPRGSRDMCKNMRSIKGRTKGKNKPAHLLLAKDRRLGY